MTTNEEATKPGPSDDEELASRRPSAGSAEELLDAGAERSARSDAPLGGARHGRGGPRPVPRAPSSGIGPAIDDGFYYDFDLPRPLTTDDLPAIEERMRESIAADHPFVRRELAPDEGRAFFVERGQPYKVEILDDLRRRRRARRRADAADVATYEHGPFIDLCRGPARRIDRQDRAVQAARGRRRVLARRREAADAPAHLRHGLVDAGGARPLPVAARGGAASATTARWASQLDLFSFHDVSPGSAFWHPKGWTL